VQLFDKAHSLSILESVDLIPQHVAQTNEATSSYRLFFGVLTVWSEIVWVVGWKAILCRARFEIYETAAPAPHQPKPNARGVSVSCVFAFVEQFTVARAA